MSFEDELNEFLEKGESVGAGIVDEDEFLASLESVTKTSDKASSGPTASSESASTAASTPDDAAIVEPSGSITTEKIVIISADESVDRGAYLSDGGAGEELILEEQVEDENDGPKIAESSEVAHSDETEIGNSTTDTVPIAEKPEEALPIVSAATPVDEDTHPDINRVDWHLMNGQKLGEDEVFVQLVWRSTVRHGLKRQLGSDTSHPRKASEKKGMAGRLVAVASGGAAAGEVEEEWREMAASKSECKCSRKAMARSPFLAKMLETTWKTARKVEINIRESFTSLAALTAAMNFLHTGVVEGGDYDEFELIAAASLLQIDALVDTISSVIARALDVRSIVHAIEYSYKFGVGSLLLESYKWLKSFLESTGGRGTSTIHSKDRALDGRVVSVCLRRLPKDVFAPVVEHRRVSLLPFTRPKPVYQLCTMFREKLSDGTTLFNLYSNHDRSFLLCAIKLQGRYWVTTRRDADAISRTDESVVGSMAGNLLCTQFTLYDDGPDPQLCPAILFPVPPRKDIGVVMYGHNVLGNSPRSLTVVVPRYVSAKSKSDDTAAASKDGVDLRAAEHAASAARNFQKNGSAEGKKDGEDMSIAARCQRGDFKGLTILNNLTPHWNPQIQAYTMNFYDRVKLASKKNFQLVVPSREHEPAVLLFGKNGKNEYALDFRSPISAVQALLIVLSHFDHRLGLT